MTEFQDVELVISPPGHPPRHVRVLHMVRGRNPSPFSYVQKSRNGELKNLGTDPEATEAAATFYGTVAFWAGSLGRYLQNTKFSAMVRVPSRFKQAEWLRGCATKAGTADISERFRKVGHSLAGEGATVEKLRGDLEYTAAGDESSFRSILVVDDSVHTGSSVAAVVALLLDAGVHQDAEFTLACYFWSIPEEEELSAR